MNLLKAQEAAQRPHLLNQEDVSDMLGISQRTLERMRVTGDGPKFAKLGRRVLYRPADIDAWIASRVVSSTSEGRAAQ